MTISQATTLSQKSHLSTSSTTNSSSASQAIKSHSSALTGLLNAALGEKDKSKKQALLNTLLRSLDEAKGSELSSYDQDLGILKQIALASQAADSCLGAFDHKETKSNLQLIALMLANKNDASLESSHELRKAMTLDNGFVKDLAFRNLMADMSSADFKSETPYLLNDQVKTILGRMQGALRKLKAVSGCNHHNETLFAGILEEMKHQLPQQKVEHLECLNDFLASSLQQAVHQLNALVNDQARPHSEKAQIYRFYQERLDNIQKVYESNSDLRAIDPGVMTSKLVWTELMTSPKALMSIPIVTSLITGALAVKANYDYFLQSRGQEFEEAAYDKWYFAWWMSDSLSTIACLALVPGSRLLASAGVSALAPLGRRVGQARKDLMSGTRRVFSGLCARRNRPIDNQQVAATNIGAQAEVSLDEIIDELEHATVEGGQTPDLESLRKRVLELSDIISHLENYKDEHEPKISRALNAIVKSMGQAAAWIKENPKEFQVALTDKAVFLAVSGFIVNVCVFLRKKSQEDWHLSALDLIRKIEFKGEFMFDLNLVYLRTALEDVVFITLLQYVVPQYSTDKFKSALDQVTAYTSLKASLDKAFANISSEEKQSLQDAVHSGDTELVSRIMSDMKSRLPDLQALIHDVEPQIFVDGGRWAASRKMMEYAAAGATGITTFLAWGLVSSVVENVRILGEFPTFDIWKESYFGSGWKLYMLLGAVFALTNDISMGEVQGVERKIEAFFNRLYQNRGDQDAQVASASSSSMQIV